MAAFVLGIQMSKPLAYAGDAAMRDTYFTLLEHYYLRDHNQRIIDDFEKSQRYMDQKPQHKPSNIPNGPPPADKFKPGAPQFTKKKKDTKPKDHKKQDDGLKRGKYQSDPIYSGGSDDS